MTHPHTHDRPAGSPVLKVTDIRKAYGAIQAVGGVSFEVRPGEIFGVIGPNGSGKTTLFNSMLGQITPDSGRIELNGEDVTTLGPLALNRRGVGRTFQTLQVFGKMTVRDNLIVAAQEHHGSMFSRMFAPSDSGLGAKADALIDQFHIRHVAEKKAGELSYGQQKLVDIAMAFMSEPDLVLLMIWLPDGLLSIPDRLRARRQAREASAARAAAAKNIPGAKA